MKQFSELTKYIPMIEQNEIGHWQIDRENDGTPEHPIQFPFVIYSEMVNQFYERRNCRGSGRKMHLCVTGRCSSGRAIL